jgi:hypothetical protein
LYYIIIVGVKGVFAKIALHRRHPHYERRRGARDGRAANYRPERKKRARGREFALLTRFQGQNAKMPRRHKPPGHHEKSRPLLDGASKFELEKNATTAA